jgi:predicted nucleotidyltransferase
LQPSKDLLDELIRRIVGAVRPRRIILFGSAARGELGPNSDLDLLVVVRDGVHRRRAAKEIYRALLGLGYATDIIVATESVLETHKENPYMVYHSALQDGKEIFRAA